MFVLQFLVAIQHLYNKCLDKPLLDDGGGKRLDICYMVSLQWYHLLEKPEGGEQICPSNFLPLLVSTLAH